MSKRVCLALALAAVGQWLAGCSGDDGGENDGGADDARLDREEE